VNTNQQSTTGVRTLSNCKLIIKDEVNIQIDGLAVETRRKLVSKLKYELPYARHMPAYKLGRWDGTKTFFSIGGTGFLAHLDVILPIIQNDGYEIEIEDKRKPIDLKFDPITESYWADQGKVWPEGHRYAGEPIMLREDQAHAVNMYLQNPQSLQSISTGAGKCQPLTCNVLTPTGFRPMGDIQVGDLVLTPTGESVAVLDVFEPGNKDVYALTFEDGRTTRACGDHIWKVFVNSDWSHVTTESLIVLLGGTSALSIPMVTMDHQSASNPVDLSMRLHLIEQLNKLLGTPLVTELKSEAEGFQQLVRSIGGLARLAYNDGKYTVDATLPVPDLKLQISDIKLVSNEPVKCIMIDSPEHLYVTDDFIVTHNTITTATLSQLCEPYGRSMVIVPSKDLVLQTEEDYKNVGLDVGVYYGDRKELGKTHTICTWQSLEALDKKDPDQAILSLAEFIDGVTAVIVDECHAASASILTKLLTQNFKHCPIRWGLTGTVPKEPHEFQGILASLGSVINTVTAKDLQDLGILADLHINILQTNDVQSFKNYQAEYDFLVTDTRRLTWMASKIIEMTATGNTLVLVNRIETGNILTDLIPNSTFINGSVKSKNRKTEYDEIKTSDDKVIIATFGVASTGINLPRIFNLVLVEPGKSFTRVIQSIGRGIRKADDKDYVDVYDITSACKYAKKHLTERKRYYKEAQYPFTVTKVNL
jgi:hypothetical protein